MEKTVVWINDNEHGAGCRDSICCITTITSKGAEESLGDFEIINGVLVAYTGSSTDVTIPKGVTGIEDHAFSDCSSMTGITIPKGVTSIGNYAFSGCSAFDGILWTEE